MTGSVIEAAINARREELLTVKQYAQMVGVDQQTVYRRIWSGRQRGVCRDAEGQYRIDVCVALQTMTA